MSARFFSFSLLLGALPIVVLAAIPQALPSPFPTTGSIESSDPRLEQYIAPDALVEVLAEGFSWAEGPVWLPDQDALVFSDVPTNTVYRWSAQDGLSVYLHPSGHTGFSDNPKEEGSNGLALDPEGRLVLCQHGDRRLARMTAPVTAPAPEFTTLAARWEGQRLNSPNDLTINAAGQIFFTDPIYGLVPDDPSALPFKGVFRLDPDGALTLLSREETMPNGIALSPDGRHLYVANSDWQEPSITVFELDADGNVLGSRELFDAKPLLTEGRPGSPDGLKVHPAGVLFATGPGGVLVIDPRPERAVLLGTIRTERATANCAFNEDYTALYLTSSNRLLRVALRPPEIE